MCRQLWFYFPALWLIFLLTNHFRARLGSRSTSVSLPVGSALQRPLFEDPSVRIDDVAVEVEPEFKVCSVEPWNNVTTEKIPMEAMHKKWRERSTGNMGNLAEGQLRVISAFVYKDEVVVTTTSQNRYGKQVFCRYFDCNRIEIPNSAFQNYMFPMSSAYCARRAGAKFIGLTETLEEEPIDPVPVTFRAHEEPVHDVAVCVGPIYGNESRWLEIVETTEHHILMGIHYFYFTVFNDMDSYTRKLLDEYERLETAEVTVVQSEYKVMDWMFHMIQISDCFFRARHHSKWILNVDIDERLVMTQLPLRSFIDTISDDVGEISFATNKIQRTQPLPTYFSGTRDLEKQLLFLNFNASSETFYLGMKGLVRPDKTEAMFYHWTWRQHPGVRVMSAPKKLGYIRHYRTTLPGLVKNWVRHGLKFRPTRLNWEFEEKLLRAVVKRVERVYDQRVTHCEEIPERVLAMFSKDNYHCQWKNGTSFGDQ